MIESVGFPVLSAIIFLPIVMAVVILFLPADRRDLIRGFALMTAVALLVLSGLVFFAYNDGVGNLSEKRDALVEGTLTDPTDMLLQASNAGLTGTALFVEGLAFEEEYDWVPSLGIRYHVGVDGLNAPMVLLTGMVAVAGVLISWNIQDRLREFYAFFLLLVAGVYGVFVAIDLFLLFFFYELAIFPMYLLIAGWGWVKLREYAAM